MPVSSGVWLAQDRRGVTPLHHAAVHDNHKCLQTLLKYAAPGTLDTEDHKKVRNNEKRIIRRELWM